ncbi:U6 snRNA-associated Sm-like protein LSm11 isoform 1-T1 [Glossina fuscipes fuscipes]
MQKRVRTIAKYTKTLHRSRTYTRVPLINGNAWLAKILVDAPKLPEHYYSKHIRILENASAASNDQSKSQEEEETKPQEEKTDQSSSRTDSQELDISSDLFNPLKALYAKDYRITVKNPKIIYQNFAAFESALAKVGIYGLNKPSNKDALPSTSKAGAKEEPLRRFQNYQLPVKSQTQMKKRRNLFTQMTQSNGPLSELNKYISSKCKVRVIVRKEQGIRGYVMGFLQYFDRHWNLLLTDVEECYKQRKFKYADQKLPLLKTPEDCSRRLRKLGLTLPLQSAKSLNRKTVEIKRHTPQLLLRGEHVVLVQLDNKEPQ